MRATWLILALGLGPVVLSGCGRPQAAHDQPESHTTPATALVPAGGAASVTPAEPAVAEVPNKPGKVTQTNEDGSETVEETTGDSGAHNSLLAAVASTMAATAPSAAAATIAGPTMWQEGVNYTRLVPAQPTSVATGQVEVLEFFWYGCPHCYAIDAQVETWRKKKPAYIAFSRVPVGWSEGHRSTARLYYTLESLGKLDQMHSEVFKEIHVNGDPLIGTDPNDTAGAERIEAAFVKKLGISEEDFHKAYHSFAVETAMQRAEQLVLRYRVEGVPTFVVNGKYVADLRSAGGPERMISLLDDLAAQEHKH